MLSVDFFGEDKRKDWDRCLFKTSEWLEKRYQSLQSKNVEDLRTYAVLQERNVALDTIAENC